MTSIPICTAISVKGLAKGIPGDKTICSTSCSKVSPLPQYRPPPCFFSSSSKALSIFVSLSLYRSTLQPCFAKASAAPQPLMPVPYTKTVFVISSRLRSPNTITRYRLNQAANYCPQKLAQSLFLSTRPIQNDDE